MLTPTPKKLSSSINNSIERQMVQSASAGKLTIMKNKGGELEPWVIHAEVLVSGTQLSGTGARARTRGRERRSEAERGMDSEKIAFANTLVSFPRDYESCLDTLDYKLMLRRSIIT
jgi:hypothetical protein